MFQGLKSALVKWLGILPTQNEQQIIIREYTTRESDVLKNKLWYRGDPAELEQFYKMVAGMGDGFSTVAATRFWASVSGTNTLVRKFHSGLPRIMIDKLAGIVVEDMDEAKGSSEVVSRWNEIADDVDFIEILKEAVQKVLTEGDGAFKICIDTDLSNLPLIEFHSGNEVEYTYKRGKLQEIKFLSDYWEGTKQYRLVEYYGKGYVNYKLFDSLSREVPLDTLEDTAILEDITFTGDYIMGVPLKFKGSAKWDNRGDGLLEGKEDVFDALDECLSTWLDAIRGGRVKQYIPETLLPRNPDTGEVRKPDVFNNYYILQGGLQEDIKQEIQVKQGEVDYEGLLASYITLLDAALQGIISPSTLGIDVKKLDNAESQREKEKTTLYTRDTIIGALAKTLPKLVNVVLKTQDNMLKNNPKDYEMSFEWGQYANPSFEATVETVGKARTYGIMSIEKCVDELYGDTMSPEDRAEEVERLKAEVQVDEPYIGDEFYDLDLSTDINRDKPEDIEGE